MIRKDLKYKHTFARLETGNSASAKRIPHALFAENEYVLVSTDTRVNISAGFVIDVTEQAISVSLDRYAILCYNYIHVKRKMNVVFLKEILRRIMRSPFISIRIRLPISWLLTWRTWEV